MKQKKVDVKKFLLNKETLANLNASVMKNDWGGKPFTTRKYTDGCGDTYPEKCTSIIPLCTAGCSIECTWMGLC